MNIIRAIAIGVLLGILTFIAFKFVIALLIIFTVFRLAWGGKKWNREKWQNQRLAYIDSVRNMNEEEYSQFRNDFGHRHHRHDC